VSRCLEYGISLLLLVVENFNVIFIFCSQSPMSLSEMVENGEIEIPDE